MYPHAHVRSLPPEGAHASLVPQGFPSVRAALQEA